MKRLTGKTGNQPRSFHRRHRTAALGTNSFVSNKTANLKARAHREVTPARALVFFAIAVFWSYSVEPLLKSLGFAQVTPLFFYILAYFPVLPLAYAFSPVTFTWRFWHLPRSTWVWVIAMGALQSLAFLRLRLGWALPSVSRAEAVGTILISPPMEEIIRAVMIPPLVKRWGPGWGVGITVTLLALVHPDPLGVVVLQLALSIMFLSTDRSIPATAIAHAAMNAVSAAIVGISQN